jgi:hypothetical protein
VRALARNPARPLLTALLVAGALPVSAPAKTNTIAPPGNSGIGQYVENIPTASGGQPTSTVHPGSHGSALIPPGGSGGGPDGGSAVSAATARALASQGSDGRAAANLARTTAPQPSSRKRPTVGTAGAGQPGPGIPVAGRGGSSPASSVFKALTGSAAGAGLGPILPAVLIVSLVGVTGLALRRRRRTT